MTAAAVRSRYPYSPYRTSLVALASIWYFSYPFLASGFLYSTNEGLDGEEWSLKSAAHPAGFKLHLQLLFLLPFPSLTAAFHSLSTVLNQRFFYVHGPTTASCLYGLLKNRVERVADKKSERFEY